MDTRNPYFTHAEVTYRQQRAKQGFRSRRRRSRNPETPPIGKPLRGEDLL
ncbi:hypothetical protein [Nocardioides alcanivorans]|nr:hypothetical protein [Nocardioides alcanivorans]